LKPNYGKQNKNRKQKWPLTYWLENWNPEFLYTIIFIKGQIKIYVTSFNGFQTYVELNKQISYRPIKKKIKK